MRSHLAFPALLLACSIAVALPDGAARAAPVAPAWTRDFAAPIEWQRVTAFGQLLVSTRAGLHAVDPATGKVLWTHVDVAGLPEQGLQELAGSPLVMITGSVGLEAPRTVVLNVFNGQLVFDTRIAKVGQISAPRVLPQAGSLLVGGFEIGNVQPTLFAYSMNDGSLLWKSDVLATAMNPGGNRLLGALLSVTLAVVKIDPVQSQPLELGDGTFLLGAMGHVMRLDAATGDVRWKTPFAGGVFEFRETDARPGVVYVGAQETEQVMGADQTTQQQRIQTHYQGFRVDDGMAVWKRAVSFSKPMNRSIIALDRGLLVSDGDNDKGKLQLIDYDTGASLWGNKGRGIEVAGQVVEYSFAGTDLVLTTGYDSIWTNKDTAYLLYVLDTTSGSFRFAKPFEVKGRMLGTELTEKGLIYVTTHEINIFDPATGALRNAPVLRSRAPIVTVDDRNLVYAFNSDDGFVYSFDRDTGAVAKLSQTPFALDDDHARALDLVDGTLVLMGQQTVAGFGLDGSRKFAVHYDAPRNPTWMRALAWAEGVRMGMASVSAGMYSAAFADAAGDAAQGSAGREVATELSRGFGDLSQGYQSLSGDYIRFARRRYEASAESRDFFFMMVQHEDRRVALAQISKRDGRILSEIDLGRDKEPAYQVDDVASSVYYRPADSVVAGYRFASERVALR